MSQPRRSRSVGVYPQRHSRQKGRRYNNIIMTLCEPRAFRMAHDGSIVISSVLIFFVAILTELSH